MIAKQQKDGPFKKKRRSNIGISNINKCLSRVRKVFVSTYIMFEIKSNI